MKTTTIILAGICNMILLLTVQNGQAQNHGFHWSSPATVGSSSELVLLYSYRRVNIWGGSQDLKIICKNITTDKVRFRITYEVHFHNGEVERVASNNVIDLAPGETYDPQSVADWGGVYMRYFVNPSGGKYGPKEKWFKFGKDENDEPLYSAIYAVMNMKIIDFVNISQKERTEATEKKRKEEEARKKREEEEKKQKEEAERKQKEEAEKKRKEEETRKKQEEDEKKQKEGNTQKNVAQTNSESKLASSLQSGLSNVKEGDNRTQQQKIKDEYEEVKRKSDEKYRAQIEANQKREEENRKLKERQEAIVTEAVETLAPVVGELLAPVGQAVDNFLDKAVGKFEIPSLTMGIGKADNASYYNMKLFNFVVNTKYVQPFFGFGMHIISYPQYTFTYSDYMSNIKFYPENNETMSIGKRMGINIPFGFQGIIPLIKGETHNILSFNWELSSTMNLWTATLVGDHRIPDGDNDKDGVKKMTPTLPFIQLTGGVEINFNRSFGIGLSIGMSKIPFEETVTGYIQDYKYKYQATAVNTKHFTPIFMFKFFRFAY